MVVVVILVEVVPIEVELGVEEKIFADVVVCNTLFPPMTVIMLIPHIL
jgi:hypothetical protein